MFRSAVLLAALLTSLTTAAQQPRATPVQPAAKARSAPPAAQAPAAAGTRSSGAFLPPRATVDAFLKRMFGHDPSATWRVLDIRPSEIPNVAQISILVGNQQRATHLFVTPDGQHAIVGEVVPFGADPFAAHRARLAREATGPSRGPADAVITIVEFSDLQCPACRAAEPTLQKLLAENPDVRFVFQHFPLTEIHPWAMHAATAAECVRRESPAAFWKFAASVYEAQPTINPENVTQKLSELAAAAGVDAAKISACTASPEVAAAVEASRELGESLGVGGTPTVFINGRKLQSFGSVPYEVLTALVKTEIEYMKAGAAKPSN
jgi:protein-disulfide isomerase